MAFGFLNILAPLATANSLTVAVASSSTQKFVPSAIY